MSDVSTFTNVVGGIGRIVRLKIVGLGPVYDLAHTTIEKELSESSSGGIFTVKFEVENADPSYISQIEPKALAVLQTVANYPGFRVSCKRNIAFP